MSSLYIFALRIIMLFNLKSIWRNRYLNLLNLFKNWLWFTYDNNFNNFRIKVN